jgi:hypothetical protein
MRLLGVSSILTLALLSCRCGRRDPSKPATSKQETGSVVADVHALEGDFIAALKRRRNWSGPDGFEKCVLEPETTVDSLATNETGRGMNCERSSQVLSGAPTTASGPRTNARGRSPHWIGAP